MRHRLKPVSTRGTLLGVCIGTMLAAAAGCGEGHAIFNVDVFSFLAGEVDTVDYAAPPVIGAYDTTTTPIEISMFAGLGESSVDTVRIDVAANLINVSGDANIAFEIYFAADSASVYGGAPHFSAAGAVSGADTTAVGGSVTLTDALFSEPTLWVGIRLGLQNNAASILQGRMALSALDVRIVLNDKVF